MLIMVFMLRKFSFNKASRHHHHACLSLLPWTGPTIGMLRGLETGSINWSSDRPSRSGACNPSNHLPFLSQLYCVGITGTNWLILTPQSVVHVGFNHWVKNSPHPPAVTVLKHLAWPSFLRMDVGLANGLIARTTQTKNRSTSVPSPDTGGRL